MKRISTTIFLAVWLFALGLFCPISNASGNAVVKKKILIINSYRTSLDWSRMLNDSISNRLQSLGNNIEIHEYSLNSDVLQTMGVFALRLRAALWSLSSAEDSEKSQVLDVQSLFMTEVVPDVLVMVGEEMFHIMQNVTATMQTWRDVPMVLCGVNDSMTYVRWSPTKASKYTNMVPIEDKRSVYSIASEEYMLNNGAKINELQEARMWIENGQKKVGWVNNFNLTGVKMQINLKRNIELIRRLHPDLNELVLVDNNYYSPNYVWYELNRRKDSLLQGVVLERVVSTALNSDSIYNAILTPEPGKVYLTHSWKIEGMYSRRFETQMDSLFAFKPTAPVYSLSEQIMDNNYYIGGYYPDLSECADKSVRIIKRIIDGEDASKIPFDSVARYNFVLNKSALQKNNLNGSLIENAILKNHPISFFKRYERCIFYTIILVSVLIGMIYFRVRHKRFCRVMSNESERYMRLYGKIQTIYHYALIDFAMYDHNGKCTMRVIDGKKRDLKEYSGSLLPRDIFLSNYFSDDHIRSLRIDKQIVRVEVNENRETYGVMAKPIKIGGGQDGYMVVMVDLRQIVAARREREIYEQMFDFVSEFAQLGVAAYDMDYKRFMANDAWYSNLNEPPLKDGGKPTYISVIDIDRNSLVQFFDKIKQIKDDASLQRDIRVVDTQGVPHWVKQNIFVRRQGDGYRIIELNVNIDYQKESENKLREAKRNADLSNIEIKEFLESMSHEIRTPLNSIVGFSSIFTSVDPEDRDEFIPVIRKNQRMLNDLINNIICLSQIDSDELTFRQTSVELSSVFHDIVQSEEYDTDRGRVRVNCPPNITVQADERYLRIVIHNLLSNAIKFSPSGEIVIGCNASPSGGYVELSVADSGCGIEERYHEKIFNRFYKLDTYMQGAGLGLSLCRAIVEKMDGVISLNSAPGQGSVFRVKLKRGNRHMV